MARLLIIIFFLSISMIAVSAENTRAALDVSENTANAASAGFAGGLGGLGGAETPVNIADSAGAGGARAAEKSAETAENIENTADTGFAEGSGGAETSKNIETSLNPSSYADNNINASIPAALLNSETKENGAQAFYAADASVHFTVKELIVKHAREMGLDPALALSIAKAESNFCHNKTSRGGAVGVFQLMPRTAAKMGYNPYSLNDNIKAGIQYYKKMYKIFGSMELALAAYNAGPGNVKKYGGVPPFSETRQFISKITADYKNIKINSDPAIKSCDNKIKEINLKTAEYNFRMKQETAVLAYLSEQGV